MFNVDSAVREIEIWFELGIQLPCGHRECPVDGVGATVSAYHIPVLPVEHCSHDGPSDLGVRVAPVDLVFYRLAGRTQFGGVAFGRQHFWLGS